MLKTLLATSALAAVLATGLQAQTDATPAAPPAPALDAPDPAAPTLPGTWGPINLTTVAAEDLIGTDIVTLDNEKAATLTDVILTPSGEVQSVVVRIGGFLGMGGTEVLLSFDEIQMMRDDSDALILRTPVAPETIGARQPYEG